MKILHLYYDLMDLYGEYANISAMERILSFNSIGFTTDKKTIGDTFEPGDYDFIYIGSGTERKQKLILEDIRSRSSQLREYIEGGKTALFTGNSFEILGKSITAADGTEYEGLGIADFTVTEQNKRRITSDVIFSSDFSDKELVGFINKCSYISGIKEHLFKVEMGIGDNSEEGFEGIRIKNTLGTHLTGPAMVKNPHFLSYMASLAAGKEELSTDCFSYEKKGYETTLSELKKLPS